MKNIIKSGILALAATIAIGFMAASCSDEKTEGGEDKVKVTGVSLAPTLIVSPGQSETLVAVVAPENASNKDVTWSSSSGRATVNDQGIVTGVGEGTAVITVTTKDGGYTATCEVTVVAAEVSGVRLNKETLELVAGSSEQLFATVEPEQAAIKAVTWRVDDESVAKVSSNGTVTAVKVGQTTLTVSTVEGGKTAECKIIVKDEWTIYAVGMEADFGVAIATVWKDGEILYNNMADPQWFSYCNRVYVTDDDDVYVSGYESREEGNNTAYVWKNGEVLYQLTDGSRLGFAEGIKVVGSDVYVAGYHNVLYGPSLGYVWKNGEVLYEFGDDRTVCVVNDVWVDGGDVYACGYEYFNSAEPYMKYAKIWKNGEEFMILNEDGNEGEATGLFIHNGDIYVTGRAAHPTTRYISGVVWKNGAANWVNEEPKTTVAYQSGVTNGVFYTAGWGYHESGLNVGMVWQDWKVRLTYGTELTSTFHDLKTAGNDVFVGGNLRTGIEDYHHARIWKNGEILYTYEPETYNYTDVHGIFIK